MTANSSPQSPAHALSQACAEEVRSISSQHPLAPPSTLGTASPVLHTPLLGREPGTDDYELARVLLDRQFPHGHTAWTLLDLYRERDIDLTVDTVFTDTGATTRLVITTGFTPLSAPRGDRPSGSGGPFLCRRLTLPRHRNLHDHHC